MNFFYALLVCMVSCLCGSEATIWSSSCCLKKYAVKHLPGENVVDCKVQRAGLCPFDAIIIRTCKGWKLCYDPKEEWVVQNVVINGTNTCDVLPKKNSRNCQKAGRGPNRGTKF
ncbi:hypothetical protein AMELA_G00223590 [Ameiurus melas]|uniref:Chemokine interleukin-8-like domain-containing protein n=1 Tax=Ameiurus melas TaxID=219545 RepID=A0A7J5ZYY2_AMEME|nr:hypothetical protein AMELA_G00223590 [Ameiurus melas]